MADWFARPVLHVADIEASLRFYLDGLGFTSPFSAEFRFRQRCETIIEF